VRAGTCIYSTGGRWQEGGGKAMGQGLRWKVAISRGRGLFPMFTMFTVSALAHFCKQSTCRD
jgi:hypothetical protein